jgi:hypothetical protein
MCEILWFSLTVCRLKAPVKAHAIPQIKIAPGWG